VSAFFESLTGFSLLDPRLLFLALLVPVALWIRGRRGARNVLFAPGRFLLPADGSAPRVSRSWRVVLRPLPRVLQVLALLLLVVALARPVERVPLPLETEGIDILLCLDTSSSMTANDMDAERTRLEVAKDAAARFVAGRKDDRIGLIGFARYPDVRCPLTLDHGALETVLLGTETVESDGPEDATGIGTAVARAAQVLDGSDARSKVVILLTDGEENVATADKPQEIAPIHAAQLCERLGVRVYTIAAGVGRPDASGALSRRTGGAFFEAQNAASMTRVYTAIDAMEKAVLEDPRYVFEERFLAFLAAGLVLLILGRVLESTVLEVLP